MKPPRYNKVPLNSRVSEDIYEIVLSAMSSLKIEKREFIELSILSFIEQMDNGNFVIDGVDFIEYAKVRKKRLLRQMQGIFRTEIKSKALIMNNIKDDILQFMIAKAPIKELKKILMARKLECLHYEDSEDLIKQLDGYLKLEESDYKNAISILTEQNENTEGMSKSKTRVLGLLNMRGIENE